MAIPADTAPKANDAARRPAVRGVPFDAPWQWLDRGWRDVWAVPHITLAFGAIASAGAFLIAAALVELQALPLLLPLGGGFLLIGPLLAVGLYEVSRRRAAGQTPAIQDILKGVGEASGRLALFGLLLLIIYFVWVRVAFLLFMLFFGTEAFPPLKDFVPFLIFTPAGLSLLVAGTATGGVLAVLSFALSVIGVPMLYDRASDPVTASATSVRAVVMNQKAMALWACLIAAATVTGIATLFLGLIVTFPLIGCASWHAYCDIVGKEL